MPICVCTKCCKESRISIDGVWQPGKWLATGRARQEHVIKHGLGNTTAGAQAGVDPHEEWDDSDGDEEEREKQQAPPTRDQAHTSKAKTDDKPATLATVVQLCCLLVIWLHTSAGVSRNVANTVLKALSFILVATLATVEISLKAQGITSAKLPTFDIPADIRTAFKIYQLEPEIERTACCPKCYTLYSYESIDDMPDRCGFQRSPRARKCNTSLKRGQKTSQGLKDVPQITFNTQKFESWLEFFMSQKAVEDHLQATHLKSTPAEGQPMADLHDSPAWAEDLKDYRISKYNLVFGLYIDWFNPYGNKVSGKQVSCGAVVLYCLNLPLEARYLPENVFLVGLLPSPFKPDAVVLTHLMDPLVKKILEYENPGKQVATYYHKSPGVYVQTRIIPLIADLPAAREAGGFLSHSATKFCWFCHLTKDELHRLDHLNWRYRTGPQVCAAAKKWRNEKYISGRDLQAKKTGVRWCSLHHLPYWNPVKHTLLGYMHNWLEGVLSHQLRTLWGVGRDIKKAKALLEIEDLERLTEADVSESASEVSSLDEEGEQFRDPNTLANIRQAIAEEEEEDEGWEDEDDTPRASPVPRDQDVSMLDVQDYEDIAVHGNFKFLPAELEKIRTCIQEISLPTWVSRPPGNLGEKKHGRLKADEFLVLFTVILPVVIPEIRLHVDETRSEAMLQSFYHLVAATNILSSFRISDSEAEAFTRHYVAWRTLVQEIFPDCNDLPNLHFAMHNEQLLKYWGPLAALAEFWGERINGMFQKIKTNRHMWDMDYTMLRQMSRRFRLLAHQHNHGVDDKDLKEFMELLQPERIKAKTTGELNGFGIAKYLRKAAEMPEEEYELVLAYLNSTGQQYVSWRTLPDLEYRSMILPPRAKRLKQFYEEGRAYSCCSSHRGNSLIQFQNPGTEDLLTGSIETILEIPLHGFLKKFLLVRPHRELDMGAMPYTNFPRMFTWLVDIEPEESIILLEPMHIITHLTSWKRPAGTYKFNKDFMVVCSALDRGRRRPWNPETWVSDVDR